LEPARNSRAITALELIVAMAIAAILLAASVPAYRDFGWNLRMKTAMHGLRTDLNLARSRAISLDVQTVACPAMDSGAGPACSGGNEWHGGWIIFADLNADRQRQATEPLLSRGNAVEFLTIRSSRYRKNLRFYPDGSAAGSNATVSFCDRRGRAHAGTLSLSNTGRITLTTGGRGNAVCP
jgi:type IV fimbrial biogenesis protein FimT